MIKYPQPANANNLFNQYNNVAELEKKLMEKREAQQNNFKLSQSDYEYMRD